MHRNYQRSLAYRGQRFLPIFLFVALVVTTSFIGSFNWTQLVNAQTGISKLEEQIKGKTVSPQTGGQTAQRKFINFGGRSRRKLLATNNIKPVQVDPADMGSIQVTVPASPKLEVGLVTFATNVGKAEISVNGKIIGQTSSDKQLQTHLWLVPSEVTVTHPGYYPSAQILDLGNNSQPMTINLDIDADATFKRFQDPQQTASLTIDDWQLTESALAARLSQDSTDAGLKARHLFAKGQVAFFQGNYPVARNFLNETSYLVSNSAIVFYAIGNVYLKLGKLKDAKKAYKRAIDINPVLAMAYCGIGNVLTEQGNLKDAVIYYDKALTQGYKAPEIHISIARNLMRKRQWGNALSELIPFSKSDPNTTTFILMGNCYMALAQYFDAYNSYRQATVIDDKSAQAHFKAGEALMKLQNYSAAKEEFEQALLSGTNNNQLDRSLVRKMLDKANSSLAATNKIKINSRPSKKKNLFASMFSWLIKTKNTDSTDKRTKLDPLVQK